MTRGTNFSLIEKDELLQNVFKAGVSIEDLITFSQNLTLIKERFFIEEFANYLIFKHDIKRIWGLNLHQKLNLIYDNGYLELKDLNVLIKVKNDGNSAVHQGINGKNGIHREHADKLFIILKKYIKVEKKLSQAQVEKELDTKFFATYLGKEAIETIINTKCDQIETCLKNNSVDSSHLEHINKQLHILEQKLANSQKENLVTKSDLKNFADAKLTSYQTKTKKLTEHQITQALLKINKTKDAVLYELTKLEKRVGKIEINIQELVKITSNHENRLIDLEKTQYNLETVKNTIQNASTNIEDLKRENHRQELRSQKFTEDNLKQSVVSVNHHTKKTVNKGIRNLGILIILLIPITIVATFLIQKSTSPSVIASAKEGEILTNITGKVMNIRTSNQGYIFIDLETSDGLINVPVFNTKKIKKSTEIQEGDTLSVSGEFDIYEGQKQIKPELFSDIQITKKATISNTTQNSSSIKQTYSGEIINKYIHTNGHIFLTVQTLDETLEVPLFDSINPTDIFEVGDIIDFSGEEGYYKNKKQIVPKSMEDVNKITR